MKLERIEIKHLWSFGSSNSTFIEEFGRINVVIGKNNVGKSNLMRAIGWIKDEPRWIKDEFSDHEVVQLTGSFCYNPGSTRMDINPELRTTFSLNAADWKSLEKPEIKDLLKTSYSQPLGKPEIKNLLNTDKLSLESEVDMGFRPLNDDRLSCELFANVRHLERKRLENCCSVMKIDIQKAMDILKSTAIKYIPNHLVALNGWRRLENPVAGKPNFYELIHALDSAVINEQICHTCLDTLKKFFCKLTCMDGVQLAVRGDKQGLNVTIKERTLPLTNFGDGIAHLLMIAAEAALQGNCVILIEEPETHLHPQLQRHLLQFLAELPFIQVIITTHSPIFLDLGIVDRVIRVDHDGEQSKIQSINTPKQIYEVLDDLGSRASDILQANVVIWVEGPSDRIFLKRCLDLIVKDRELLLTEGLHYQIVYYGGAMRTHLTFNESIDSLINVLRLSRNVIMICDSDRKKDGDPIDKTKKRLEEECRRIGGIYWITEGREIENYISNDVFTRSYRQLLTDGNIQISLGKYDKLGQILRKLVPKPLKNEKFKIDYDNNKVVLMREFVNNIRSIDDLSQYDLKTQLDKVINFIKNANT